MADGEMPQDRVRSGVTRRGLLVGGTALAGIAALGLPRIMRSKAELADADVVIIGAGAAGLAAARIFTNNGRSAIVLEASGRIGGRAHTETTTFGVPCDHGAHWLHYGERNPFKAYGESINPADISLSPEAYSIFDPDIAAPGNRLPEADVDDFKRYWRSIGTTLCDLNDDKSPHAKLVDPALVGSPAESGWFGSAALLIGNWDMGKDWVDFSNANYQHTPNQEFPSNSDYLWKPGFGALVHRSGEDIEVRLGVTARRVARAGNLVAVDTDQGTVTARACIVTVSTGVITSGALEIANMAPDLMQAFHDVSMGTYNRIALQFTQDVFSPGAAPQPDHFAFTRVKDVNDGRPEGIVFTTNVAGSNLVYGDVGGTQAEDLERDGPDAMIAYALDEVKSMLGGDALTMYTGTALATQWRGHPLFHGSFASPKPGKAHQRAALKDATTDELIFHAGEAHHDCEWATVSGAHKSGCATAQRVMQMLYGTPIEIGLCKTVGLADSIEPVQETRLCWC
jgi:monoamine oxidase